MSQVLVIQNTRIEGIGTLGQLLRDDGFDVTTAYAKKQDIPQINPDLVIILGAPESANDDLPHLKKELELIKKLVDDNTPLLGICLGSQLIAKAFGARVYKGPKKEIGFYSDVEFDNISSSKLFRGISSPATVFHWHGDTFDLPHNAIRLAHSKDYQNQAIRVGSAVGVQFHLEVDETTIRLWLEKSKEEISNIPHINLEKIGEQIPESLKVVRNNLEIFYKNFKSEFNL